MISPILKLSLDDQCERLGIPLQKLPLTKNKAGWVVGDVQFGRPETAAFAHLTSVGCVGLAAEGAGPLTLLKCAALGVLIELNTFGSRADACSRYFEAQCVIHAAQKKRIVDQIRLATAETVCDAFREVRALPNFRALYPEMDEVGIRALWTVFGAERWALVAEAFFVDPYGFRAGWPDLAVVDGDRLRMIEVKTSDKLHASQVHTFSELLKPLGFRIEVLQLVRA